MDQQPASKKRELVAALAVLIVIVAIVAGASTSAHKQSADMAAVVSTPVTKTGTDTSNTTNTTGTDTSGTSGSTITATSTYKDGNYTTVGSYDSPDGTELLTVQITLQNDVVTATAAQVGAHDPEGREYQNQFIASYKQLVVGKNIDSIQLSRVSGSSLTSLGFNNALAKIRNQAKQNA